MVGPRDTSKSGRASVVSSSLLLAWYQAEAHFGTRFAYLSERAKPAFRAHVRWLLSVRAEAGREREQRRLVREQRWAEIAAGRRRPLDIFGAEFADLYLGGGAAREPESLAA